MFAGLEAKKFFEGTKKANFLIGSRVTVRRPRPRAASELNLYECFAIEHSDFVFSFHIENEQHSVRLV